MAKTDEKSKRNHAEYMRARRKAWTPEEVQRNRELSRLRMQRKREKLKQESSKQNESGDVRLTRQAEQRELDRKKQQAEYKRQYRLNLTSQKKRRIREKDASRKRLKRLQMRQDNRGQHDITVIIEDQASDSEPSQSSHAITATALKKMIYRAKKKLPKSPNKYAVVVKGLTTCVTPLRKAALREQGMVTSPNAKRNLENILSIVKDVNSGLQGTSSDIRRRRKEFVHHFAERLKDKSDKKLFCLATGIKRKYIKTCSDDLPKKRRKDAISTEIQESVSNFYESEAVIVPDKKAVNKKLEKTQVLPISIVTAWSKWKEENPGKQLSFDKFQKLRPKTVKTQKYRKLYQCLCEYCENVKLKLQAVNRLADRCDQPDLKLSSEFLAVNATLCPKSEGKFHQLDCIDRKCEYCGTDKLKEILGPLMNVDEVKWKRWENVQSVNPKTHKQITKRQEVDKSGSSEDLVEELVAELGFLSVHLFEAQWQQQQFSLLKDNLPEKSVSLTIDFAENYTCFCQNEIQGAHWSKDSVTIHPCVCVYHCPSDNELVSEYVDIVSDDLNHDSHAVHTFVDQVIKHLKETRHIDIDHVYLISDGCASQYKSRVTFMDVSCSMQDYNVTIERSYYGSRHGKNRCDGEAGVLKSKATRDVKNRKSNIYDARTFFDSVKGLEKPALSENGECLHTRRTVLFVSGDNIIHERPDRNCKTVPGTRKLHSVLGVERGIIKTRRLSCFCSSCLQRNFDECLNKQYVDEWKLVKLKCILFNQTLLLAVSSSIFFTLADLYF